MIRIEKPAGPKILTGAANRGPKETQELKAAFDAGEADFEFTSSIYGAESVKNALIKAQHGKCCFCESQFNHVSYGDVEHFRPKGGWVQTDGEPLSKPGYYWLAYDWSNLFASCQLCNQRFKKNHFPLVDANDRAISHHVDIADETPLLPHPADEDPEQFLTYDSDGNAVAINDDPRGIAMIKIFGLDRTALVIHRVEVLSDLVLLKKTYLSYKEKEVAGTLSPAEAELKEKYKQHFVEITDHTSEYSVLRKSFLAGVL